MACKCKSAGAQESRECVTCTCTCACPERVETPAADNPCLNNPCSTADNIAALRASYYPAPGTDCAPILLGPAEGSERERERCTDPNGCTGLYPVECRDQFWPAFSHPRWLCCADLYAGQPV